MKPAFLFLASLTASPVLVLAQVPDRAEIPAPAETVREEVGISSNDGITASGQDILITRNGVSERLTKEMSLTNGTRVLPDGSITLSDGTKISLKANQVLSFAGVIRTVPDRAATLARPIERETVVQVLPAPANTLPVDSTPATTVGASTVFDGVAFYNGLPYFIRNGRASVIDSKLVPNGQILTNEGRLVPIPTAYDIFSQGIQPGSPQSVRSAAPADPLSLTPGERRGLDGKAARDNDITTQPGSKARIDNDITTKPGKKDPTDPDITKKPDK